MCVKPVWAQVQRRGERAELQWLSKQTAKRPENMVPNKQLLRANDTSDLNKSWTVRTRRLSSTTCPSGKRPRRTVYFLRRVNSRLPTEKISLKKDPNYITVNGEKIAPPAEQILLLPSRSVPGIQGPHFLKHKCFSYVLMYNLWVWGENCRRGDELKTFFFE